MIEASMLAKSQHVQQAALLKSRNLRYAFSILDSRLLVRRRNRATPTTQNVHHILRVTLKDHPVSAVDSAGAQHGQSRAVLNFSKYDRDYIARVLALRPRGANRRHLERFVLER
jgi:hypothetical protein